MSYKNEQWEKMCSAIQQRSLDSISFEVKKARVLRAEILKSLLSAWDDKILVNQSSEIHEFLKLKKTSINNVNYEGIMGGDKNFKRDKSIPHFQLSNGCWFDFTIAIDETIKPAQIIAFDFELRFPEVANIEQKKSYPRFLRIDLNPRNHANDDKSMRFHLHPGHDDIMIHSPAMTPLEILHLFLYGINVADKPRNK